MLKTLTILLPIIISMGLIECKSAKDHKENKSIKEFEGIITYHEVQKSIDSTFSVDDTVKLYYANGNYVGIHSEKSPKFHIIKDYYLEKKELRLFLYNTSDSLHQLALTYPIEKLESFKVRKLNTQILSKKCEKIEVNISYTQGDSTTYSDMDFIISRDYLKVNKEHFKNWNLGFFNKVIGESGSFYLNLKTVHFDSTHKNILHSKTLDVISVTEGPVDPKIFEINYKKIIPPYALISK